MLATHLVLLMDQPPFFGLAPTMPKHKVLRHERALLPAQTWEIAQP